MVQYYWPDSQMAQGQTQTLKLDNNNNLYFFVSYIVTIFLLAGPTDNLRSGVLFLEERESIVTRESDWPPSLALLFFCAPPKKERLIAG